MNLKRVIVSFSTLLSIFTLFPIPNLSSLPVSHSSFIPLLRRSKLHPTSFILSLMLTHHRKPVCFSLMALDLPLCSVVEAAATIYEKEPGRFHVLFTEPIVKGCVEDGEAIALNSALSNHLSPLPDPAPSQLLWLEVSPYRVILTMQGNGNVSYRHFWERGVFGVSRYWLQHGDFSMGDQMRLRNYTRSLTLTGSPLPQTLRVEYELWTEQMQLGRYVLNLEIHH